MFVSGVTSDMIGSNFTPELQARDCRRPARRARCGTSTSASAARLSRIVSGTTRTCATKGSERTVPGMFANKNAGDPTKWLYEADTTRPAVLAASYRITALRLTSQATPRNKFAAFYDQQLPCEGGAAAGFSGSACRTTGGDGVFAGSTAAPTPSASATSAPETAAYRDYGNRVAQAKWTTPLSDRLLLEASFGMYRSRYGGGQVPGLETESSSALPSSAPPDAPTTAASPA